MHINSLKQSEAITAVLMVKRFEIKTSKNAKEYLDLVFADKTGEISAKMWDVGADVSSLKDEMFLKVSGMTEMYNHSLQLRVDKLEKADPSASEIADLIETAPFPPNKMYDKIIEVLRTIENEQIRLLTLSIFESKKEKLMYYPAAKGFHHTTKGGLLHHIYTMLRCASVLLDIYAYLNKDLVYAGVVLHDIGKLREMTASEYGVITDYTAEGNLIGHIISGICEIHEVAKTLNTDPEISLLLEHMLLSHHGIPEYGSPKPPMFGEAELLHYLDVLDARMNQFEKAAASVSKGTFSSKVPSLDKRMVYNHGLNTEAEYES